MSASLREPPRIFDDAYYQTLAEAERVNPWAAAMRCVGVELLRRELDGRRVHSILDAGCGSGYFVKECARELAIDRIVGGDLAAEAVRAARADGLAITARLSVDRLPFPDALFDVVVSNDVLQHLTEDQCVASLAETRRVLAPGGVALIRTAARRGLGPKKHIDAEDYRQWLPASLRAALEHAGLSFRLAARVNWLPSLLADLRALSKPTPRGDVGLKLRPHESAWKERLLSAYWSGERAAVLGLGLRLPLGHTLFAAARRMN